MKKPNKRATKVLFNVRLDVQLKNKIEETAQRLRLSKTELADMAFRSFLANPKIETLAELQNQIVPMKDIKLASFNPALGQSQELELAA